MVSTFASHADGQGLILVGSKKERRSAPRPLGTSVEFVMDTTYLISAYRLQFNKFELNSMVNAIGECKKSICLYGIIYLTAKCSIIVANI